MGCSTISLSGMKVGCKDNIGGIRKALIVKAEKLEGFTLSSGSTVSAFTWANTAATDNYFYVYEFRKNTSDYQSTINSDDALGTFSVDTNINLQFSNIETLKNLEIEAISKEDLAVIVWDNMGKAWLFGGGICNGKEELPVTCSAGTLNSGKATTDGGLYNITLSTSANHFPYEVSCEIPLAPTA